LPLTDAGYISRVVTCEPHLAAVLDGYQRELGSRLDELASLRQQALELTPAAAREIGGLLDVVSDSVRRSAEASEVLAQWLATQPPGPAATADSGAARHPE